MNKLKRWFYTEKFITNDTIGTYQKIPTTLTRILEATAGLLLIATFTYFMLLVASVW